MYSSRYTTDVSLPGRTCLVFDTKRDRLLPNTALYWDLFACICLMEPELASVPPNKQVQINSHKMQYLVYYISINFVRLCCLEYFSIILSQKIIPRSLLDTKFMLYFSCLYAAYLQSAPRSISKYYVIKDLVQYEN